MKNVFILPAIATLLLSSFLFSQKKYPSLLWEISGNGLKEKSYLYGTMHVSEKIAFNLSDIFFEKFYSVKQVALESNPELWLDDIDEEINSYSKYNNYNYYDSYSYYKYNSLYLKPIDTKVYKEALRINDFLVDGILYRRYNGTQNFQENTYLDMFIYRAAKKLNKKFYGLEDIKESRKLVKKSTDYEYYDYYSSGQKPWLKKLLNGQSILTALEDAYRKQNLDLIDSITKGSSSARSLKYVLYLRNDNMVKAMDSLMKKGSLFSAVGAAHLAGKKGVIEKLREKGYTVTPLSSPYTEKGRNRKENIDHILYNQSLSTYNEYGGFSIKAPNKFLSMSDRQSGYLVSFDIPNGAFLSVSKFNHFNFLNKNIQDFSLASIDSLLYENIPGKILSKKNINNNGFKGIEVMSKNDNDEYLNTQIFLTPLEIYIFSLYGTKSYETKYKNTIFSSLRLKSFPNNFSYYSPKYGGYTAYMPEYRIISDTLNHSLNVTAYDKNNNSYYFINSRILDDISPEKETYELNRIPFEFAKNLNSKDINTTIINDSIPYSQTQVKLPNNNHLYLKTIINGSHYNIAGIVTSDETTKDKFFNSFKLTDFKSYKKLENYTNKPGGYSINIPFKPKETEDSSEEDKITASDSSDSDNVSISTDSVSTKNTPIKAEIDNTEDFYLMNDAHSYKLENEQEISISYYSYEAVSDSLQTSEIIKEFVRDRFESDSCSIKKMKFITDGISSHNYHYSDYISEKENIAQKYKIRYFYENERIYEIKYIINRHSEFSNPSAEEIFNNILFVKPENEKSSSDPKPIESLSEETISQDQDEGNSQENTESEKNSVSSNSNQTEIVDDSEFFITEDIFSDEYKIELDSLIWIANNKKNQPILNKLKILSTDYKKVENFMLSASSDSLNVEILETALRVLDFRDETKPDFYEKLYPKFKNNGDAEFIILTQIMSTSKDKKKSMKKVINLLKSSSPIPSSEYSIQNLFYQFQNIEKSENTLFPTLLSFLTINEYKEPLITYLSELNSENKLKPNHINKYKKYFYTEAQNKLKRIINNSENNSDSYYDTSYSPDLKSYLDILSVSKDSDYESLISQIKNTKVNFLLTILGEIKSPVNLTREEYHSLIKESIPSKELNEAYKKQFGQDLFNPEKDLTVELAKKILLKNNSDYDYSQKIDSLVLKEEKILNFDSKKYKIFYFSIFKNKVKENDYYVNTEIDDDEVDEVDDDDVNYVGIIAFDLTGKEKNETCPDEYNFYYEYDNNDYSDDSTPIIKTIFSSTDLNYYEEEDWIKLSENFIDYLKNKSHSRATTKFNEYDYSDYYY